MWDTSLAAPEAFVIRKPVLGDRTGPPHRSAAPAFAQVKSNDCESLMPEPLSTTVTAVVDAPADAAFDYIVPIDLRTVFKGYGLIPAVVHTTITDGWTTPGLSRTVTFADGSSSTETLLTVVPHRSFSYRNEGFTSFFLRSLISRFEGDWTFTPVDETTTRIEWTYTLLPTNRVAAGFIRLVVLNLFRGMLRNALGIMKRHLDARDGAANGRGAHRTARP